MLFLGTEGTNAMISVDTTILITLRNKFDSLLPYKVIVEMGCVSLGYLCQITVCTVHHRQVG